MASSVFFKFKSTKEPIRVEFDGTGISVFELKREIILKSGLGDGSDFDLIIAADEGMKEVYDDDTTIIPRSTTVIARRQPSRVPGRGGAARYVSGKMPVHAKNSSRREQAAKAATKGPSKAVVQMSSAMTEEEKLAAVFQAQTENWTNAQDELPQHQHNFNKSKKPVNVPDHEPPKGYVCYRCGESGHWIQLCPTNDNPDYDNRPRIKRTTGIPKSFLKTVDKATALSQMGEGDESKPSGIMVNADGEYVIAQPDKASWEQFQVKAKSNAAAQKNATQGDKEVQERGLECSIDQRMFIDPMKTPCCQKTYCNDCITNALIESDFVCPACKKEGVLIDDLQPDEEAAEKIKSFLVEQENKGRSGSKTPEKAASPAPVNGETVDEKTEQTKETAKPKSPSPPASTAPASKSPSAQASTPALAQAPTPTPTDQDKQQQSKKRPAEEVAENPKVPKAPKAMQQAQDAQQQAQQQVMLQQMMNSMPMNGMMPNMMAFPGMPMMNNFGGMGMPMGMMNPMMPPMMGGMGFPNMNMNGNFGMNGGAGSNWGSNMNGMGNGMANGMNGGMDGGMNGSGMNGGGMNGAGMNGAGMNGGSFNGNTNFQQPHKNFSQQPPADNEDAYFRKPVNPHRHQNRQRRVRPSDYREL